MRTLILVTVAALFAVACSKPAEAPAGGDQKPAATAEAPKAEAAKPAEAPKPAEQPAAQPAAEAAAPAAAAPVKNLADEPNAQATPSGLKFVDVKVGEGAQPEVGKIAVVHYTGWLTDGTKFDSSVDRGQPFKFPLGQGRVIRGWDEGVASMKVGGKRKLIIPSELGYGPRGAGSVIPPNATLVFDVELLGVE